MVPIGKVIKDIRKYKEIKQANLYDNFCSRKEISRIENNVVTPSILFLFHICLILNISLDTILFISDNGYDIYLLFEKANQSINVYDFKKFKTDWDHAPNIKINYLNNVAYMYYTLFSALRYLLKENIDDFISLLYLTYDVLNEENIFDNKKIKIKILLDFFENFNLWKMEHYISRTITKEDYAYIYILEILKSIIINEYTNINRLVESFTVLIQDQCDIKYYLFYFYFRWKIENKQNIFYFENIFEIFNDFPVFNIVKYLNKFDSELDFTEKRKKAIILVIPGIL